MVLEKEKMTQELMEAIKAEGVKYTRLNWYYKVITGPYEISDDIQDKLNEIESKYPDEVLVLQDPTKMDLGSEEANEFFNDLRSREPGLNHQYNQGVEAALVWVYTAIESGLEKANEDWSI